LEKNAKEKCVNNIKERLGISKDKKVLLYAPTFRDNSQDKHNKYTMNISLDYERLHKSLDKKFVILTRFHYLVDDLHKNNNDFIINVSNYPDMTELFLISDILITDYSSVFFDFANTDKPIFFYMDDIEEYRDNIRGFYLDIYKDLPGPICESNDELIKQIKNNSFPKDKYSAFKKRFTSLDSENCCNKIIDIIEK